MSIFNREMISGQIDRLFREGSLTALSDAELLERFVCNRDEAAFEALVSLHGPMVLGVCRRMLRDPREVEDAFQATFLVLVRKGPAIRDRELLSNWLYGVAYRVALRSRSIALRRQKREVTLGELEVPMSADPTSTDEIPPALDQELNRLPAKYRSPLVLCYLKGLTHNEAAQELRCPVGTVRSRLARGRNLLKRRLTARGYAPSAAVLASALPTPPIPASLMKETIEAASHYIAARSAVSGAAATAVESLAEGVIKTMAGSRSRTIIVGLILLTLTAGAVIGVARVTLFGSRVARNAAPPAISRPLPEPEKIAVSQPRKIKPGDWLQIEVVEALPGRPISGVRVVRPDGTITLGFYGDLQVAGLDRYEVKTKVVNHLRKYLRDEVLGLFNFDAETGNLVFVKDAQGREVLKRTKPVDSDRVFVDETADQYSWPDTPDDRLGKLEEKLDKLAAKLDSLLEGKASAKTTAVESAAPSAPSPLRVDGEVTKGADIVKAPGSNEASSFPLDLDVGMDPFQAYFQIREFSRIMEQAKLLATQRRAVADAQKLESERKATHEEVAKTRTAFETTKATIPELVRKARERVKQVRSSMAEAQAAEAESRDKDRKAEAQLTAAQSRLEDAKKLRQEGKISEEEYLDAEGDYHVLSNPEASLQPPVTRADDWKVMLQRAEWNLQRAEELESTYVKGAPAAEAKPKPTHPNP
jgi:RNA polymerase sigma factor (sigma-70 family)